MKMFKNLSADRQDSKKSKGFTLIELLVVIAIIGILSSVVLASLNSARKKSRDARRVLDIQQIQTALELYFDAIKSYPTALSALVGNYIPVEPKDPVSQTSYLYAYSPSSNPLSYHLGATLEEATNSAFSSDKDCNSSLIDSCSVGPAYTGGFDGTVTTAPLVYDVIP